jgi:hypothetical protein
MASSPLFVGTPKFASIVLNNSNGGDTAYQNPTTIATVLTVGASGARIDTIRLTPLGTNAASSVRLWVDTVGSGGTNNKLIYDVTVAATTGSSSAALTGNIVPVGLVLPANSVLRATVANTAVTNGICVNVEWGEF